MSPLDLVFLIAAGTVAGVIGTAGGITSLLAYPALLLVGVSPLTANVTSSVALLGSGAASTLRSRTELRGTGAFVRRWSAPMVLGALAGAALLLITPSGLFDRVVPFLVLAAVALLIGHPVLTGWHAKLAPRWAGGVAGAGIVVTALYDGYFGAGSGVLMLAILLIVVDEGLVRANALKNALLLIADVLPAVLFASTGRVVWPAALALGLGAVIGGLIGPTVARRAPQQALRLAAAACGVVLAVWLFIRAY